MGDLGHLGFENVITLLMIHSVSPHARRLVEKMFVDDPYLVDIKLDEDSSNRSAEILNTYLKSIGYKLVFEKTPKKKLKPFTIKPMSRNSPTSGMHKPFILLDKNQNIQNLEDWMNYCYRMELLKNRHPIKFKPFWFDD